MQHRAPLCSMLRAGDLNLRAVMRVHTSLSNSACETHTQVIGVAWAWVLHGHRVTHRDDVGAALGLPRHGLSAPASVRPPTVTRVTRPATIAPPTVTSLIGHVSTADGHTCGASGHANSITAVQVGSALHRRDELFTRGGYYATHG